MTNTATLASGEDIVAGSPVTIRDGLMYAADFGDVIHGTALNHSSKGKALQFALTPMTYSRNEDCKKAVDALRVIYENKGDGAYHTSRMILRELGELDDD